MDAYQIVTSRILEELDHNCIPWHRPWCSVDQGAFNRISGRRYSLLNQLHLRFEGEYATFAQWSSLGGKIKRGEKSECVVFWKWPEKPAGEDEEEKKPVRPVLKYYRVFHISQVEGVNPLEKKVGLYPTEPDKAAEDIFYKYVIREGINLEMGLSNEAFYAPGRDVIHIPEIRQFEHPEQFYSVAFHEGIHSTGHISRLNRTGIQQASFGSELYSKEELVAEIGAAAILHQLGIETERSWKNSVAYIDGWRSAISRDSRIVVQAASAAEKAVKFILDN